jgi:MFS family permease
MSEKPRSKLNLPANVVWLSIASMFNDISGEIVTRALPLFLAGSLGVSKSVIGVIEGVADSTASLLKIVSGWYSDRWGSRKTVAGTGYTLTALARPLLYFTTSWVIPLLSKFVDRAGKGIRTAPRDALIADSVAPDMRGRAFGFHRALDPLGAVIGALIAAWFIYHWAGANPNTISEPEWKTLILIAAIPSFISAIIVLVLVKEKRHEKREPIPFRQIFSIGSDHRFMRLIGVVGIFALGLSSDAFLILRAQSIGLSIGEIFLLIALFNTVTTLSAYPAGKLSDRIGRRVLLVAGWISYALIYLGFAYATSRWQIWALYLGYGIYYGLTEGVEKAFVADLVAPEERGAAYGLYNGAVGIAILPASIIAGVLWQYFGPSAPFLFGASVAVVSVLLLLTIRESRTPS